MVPCTSPIVRRSLGVLLGILLLTSLSLALPEIDVRSQVLGARQIAAAPPDTPSDPPLQPDQLLVTSYTCPTFGRIQILVTGRLTQSPKTHFEPWLTKLSISRNSLAHTPSARF